MSKSAQGSLLETIKEKSSELINSFDFSYENLITLAQYIGIGLGVGFVLKRYGTILFFGCVIAGLALYGLHSFDFITVNSEKLKLFFGFSHDMTMREISDFCFNWIKTHPWWSVSFCVGFFAGYKLG